MFMKSWNSQRLWSIAIALLVSLLSATCGKGSPTGPSGNAPPPPPNSGTVQLTVNPNPVPFSGVPVTDTPDCADLPNTWYYDQIFKEFGGNTVTFTSRVDEFDGFVVNNLTGLDITIPPLGSLTLRARWCSGNPTAHTALSTFSGVDSRGASVNVTTPTIHLLAP